ncbi:MAG TPA: hypothetical protein VJ044_16860, partial [Candidatus Hodarchaeales archaeon]|nr:hypothetical protein [Candidatus Hodarchaeales archaeon]
FLFVVSSLLLANTNIQSIPSVTSSQTATAIPSSPAITNGTISGTNISWAHGVTTFANSGNFTVAEAGNVTEKIDEQRIINTTLGLINTSTFQIRKIQFEVFEKNETLPIGPNSTRNFFIDNSTLVSAVLTINSSFFANETSYIENLSTTETTLVTTTQEHLGTMTTNVSLFSFRRNTTTPNIRTTWVAFPRVIVVSVERNLTQVELNVTLQAVSGLFYANRYSVQANISAEQWFVNVRDGDRMGFQATAFKKLNISYTEIRSSFLVYAQQVFSNVSLRFSNGSYVPFAMYPFSLRPAFFSTSGEISQHDVKVVNIGAISASTSFLEVFAARMSNTVNNTQFNASSLVAWMVRSTPRLVAYQDGNLDHQLNLE